MRGIAGLSLLSLSAPTPNPLKLDCYNNQAITDEQQPVNICGMMLLVRQSF